MSNNRLPFGLCKKYHIELPDNATPKDAWEALKKNGITYFEEEESTVLDPRTFLGDVDELDDRKRYTPRKTVLLPKKEYFRLISALGTKIAGLEQPPQITRVKLSNYSYTVEVYGFGNYRVIEKKRLK